MTANGSPAASFDPADFLMPDEVFQFIAELEAWGVRLAEVSCDEQWHFPGTVVSLRSAGTAMTYYRISGFRELAGGSELPVARAATGPAAGAP